MSRNRWDGVLDGWNFRLARGAETPYSKGFQHSAVTEQELFNPFLRGTMQSRGDLRSFRQTDWSGGQTWFLPTLPNAGGDTYYKSSLLDAWSKPGNLVPLNAFTETADTDMPAGGNIIRGETGEWQLITDDNYTIDKRIEQWAPASDGFVSAGDFVSGISLSLHYAAKQYYDESDNFTIFVGAGSINNLANQEVGKADVEAASGSNIVNTNTHAPGFNVFYFDGKIMLYDGDTIRSINSGKTGFDATAVTDDGLGRDVFLRAAGSMGPTNPNAGNPIIVHPAMNLALVSDRGIFYVKHVLTASGLEARIFQVEVTSAGTYLRTPIGRLPQGMAVLNVAWHLDSLLMVVTPDLYLLRENDSTKAFMETQLWHYTQGSIGAIGTFEGRSGSGTPTESPYTFPYSRGNVQYISSHDKLWAYDAVRGGVHQVYEFAGDVVGGLWGGFEDENSSAEGVSVFVGFNEVFTQKLNYVADPSTTAGDYYLESNYFEFGVPLEQKTLRSVHVLTQEGNANDTWYVDIEDDDDGTWTQVATWSGTATGVQSFDILSQAITGNRFRYRIRYEAAAGGSQPEFRGIEIKAVTGEKVSSWVLTIDATQITNVANVKQTPQAFIAALEATAEKDGVVSFTDNYQAEEGDGTAVNVRIDQVQVLKLTEDEALVQVQLTKVAV